MTCPVCKEGKMVEVKKSYFAQFDNYYVIIKNVPCHICDQCGEVVYSEEVMKKIDFIIEKLENITRKIFITDYANAA